MSAEVYSLARCRERIRWWLTQEVKAAEVEDGPLRADLLERCNRALIRWHRRRRAFERFTRSH